MLVSRPNPRLEEFSAKIGVFTRTRSAFSVSETSFTASNFPSTAKENNVETCVVEVNVEEYCDVYSNIEAAIEDKEIGILSELLEAKYNF